MGVCWSLSQLSLEDRQWYNLDRVNMHVFGLWEETGVPGVNPRKDGENMQTPHRKTTEGDSNLGPSCCLLEAPMMPPHLKADIVRYKVFLSGKSGVGKTTLAARLAGLDMPNIHYETTGMETCAVFWPVKLKESGRMLFFCFQLWDCGENATRRFDHMLPSCKEHLDAILFLFSFTDRGSFEDLSSQMSRVTEPPDRLVKLVVGTKFDLFMHTDVTESDITRFREVWGVPVFRVGGDVSGGFGEIGPLLNSLADNLWHQDCMHASTSVPSIPSYPGHDGPEIMV